MSNRISGKIYCLIHCILVFFASKSNHGAKALSAPQQQAISEIFSLQKNPLRNNPSSPWCYTARIDPTREAPGVKYNFLATQVWPSARTAAFFLERNLDTICDWKVCELGCGPALPSLVIANLGLREVIASDLDEIALEMVKEAAKDQCCDNLSTKCVDLTGDPAVIDEIGADLYIMSDVFENANVAKGAAGFTMKALQSGAKVWVFAQSDRAQRETYLQALEELEAHEYVHVMDWCKIDDMKGELLSNHPLILLDLEEIAVDYG